MQFIKENLGLVAVFIVLLGFTLWLQFDVLIEPDVKPQIGDENDPDYYVYNFTSTGMDDSGRVYELKGDKLVHFPDGRSLLTNPEIIKYKDDGSPVHISSISGLLHNNSQDVLMNDNVVIFEPASNGGPDQTATTNKMMVHLSDE